jgi:hypothetical protein
MFFGLTIQEHWGSVNPDGNGIVAPFATVPETTIRGVIRSLIPDDKIFPDPSVEKLPS